MSVIIPSVSKDQHLLAGIRPTKPIQWPERQTLSGVTACKKADQLNRGVYISL